MPKTKRRPARKKKSNHSKELRVQRFAVDASEEGVPEPEPFLDLMRAYEASPWAYACVYSIASNLASIDYKFWKELADDKFEAFKKHPIDELIKNPNPYMTEYDVKEATFSYMELTGEAYWILEDNGSGEAAELWPVPPQLMEPVQTKGKFIDHWLLNTGGGHGVRFEVDEVIQFKSFSPTSMHRGQGSTLAARNSLTLDLFQQTYNRVFFLNNARPDAILQVDDHLDDAVRRRMIRSWETAHKGLKSAHKVALLEGGTKYIKGDTTQKDMEYREGRKQNREEIIASFGCFPITLGLTDGVNFATAKEQRKEFWMNTLLPKTRRFSATLTKRARQITLILNVVVQADTSKVEALRANQLDQAKVTKTYVESGIPINQIIEAFDLPFDPIEGGDVPRAPQAPGAPSGQDEGDEEAPDNESEEDNDKRFNDGQKILRRSLRRLKRAADRLPPKLLISPPGEILVPDLTRSLPDTDLDIKWKQFDQRLIGFEQAAERAFRKFFRAQGKRVVRRLRKNADSILPFKDEGKGFISWAISKIEGRTKQESDVVATMAVIFPLPAEAEAMKKVGAVVIESTYVDFIVSMGESIDPGFAFDVSDPLAQAFIDSKTAKLVQEATATTREAISDEIVEAIEEAVREGFSSAETIDDIADRIDEVYDFAQKNRSKTIARTEVIGSANAGAKEGMKRTGVEEKQWLTARDGDVRDTHIGLDFEQGGKAIPIDESFITSSGATLDYPGDPSGPPEEIINCRCTILPVIKEEDA